MSKSRIDRVAGAVILRTAKWCMAVYASSLVLLAFGQTNRFFITDNGRRDVDPFTPDAIEKAKVAKDSQPTERDLDGHWGKITEGFQLSIRFEKDSFTNGEPITANLIVRNVTDRMLLYGVFGLNDQFKFVLTQGEIRIPRNDEPKGTNFSEILKPIQRGSMFFSYSRPGTQQKYAVDLRRKFDSLKVAEYSVQAQLEIPKLDKSGEVNITSGKALFKIVN